VAFNGGVRPSVRSKMQPHQCLTVSIKTKTSWRLVEFKGHPWPFTLQDNDIQERHMRLSKRELLPQRLIDRQISSIRIWDDDIRLCFDYRYENLATYFANVTFLSHWACILQRSKCSAIIWMKFDNSWRQCQCQRGAVPQAKVLAPHAAYGARPWRLDYLATLPFLLASPLLETGHRFAGILLNSEAMLSTPTHL
jgi:hypothetical protein